MVQLRTKQTQRPWRMLSAFLQVPRCKSPSYRAFSRHPENILICLRYQTTASSVEGGPTLKRKISIWVWVKSWAYSKWNPGKRQHANGTSAFSLSLPPSETSAMQLPRLVPPALPQAVFLKAPFVALKEHICPLHRNQQGILQAFDQIPSTAKQKMSCGMYMQMSKAKRESLIFRVYTNPTGNHGLRPLEHSRQEQFWQPSRGKSDGHGGEFSEK